MKKILAFSLFAMLICLGIGFAYGPVNTRVPASISAGTDVVITPADMTNIAPGESLLLGGQGGNHDGEFVYVSATTTTTFTATVAHPHNQNAGLTNDTKIISHCWMWGT